MDDNLIDLNEFADEKKEMLKIEIEIVKDVRKEYFIKLLTTVAIEFCSIGLVLLNKDNNFGTLMIIPTTVLFIPMTSIFHSWFIKFRDIRKMKKEINKLTNRLY